MKEVEKNEIKRLSDRLDLIRHQMAGLSLVDSEICRAGKRVREAGGGN